ncbi:MAG: hypothetical protein WKF94_14655 [Solirubrobacteraceae bacterium]
MTDEQRAFWNEIGFGLPDGEPDQPYIGQLQYVYSFDGYEVPSADAIRDEVARRQGGGGGESPDGGADALPDGGYIDLPFESGSADPQPLQYADLGPDKKYKPEGAARAVGSEVSGANDIDASLPGEAPE